MDRILNYSLNNTTFILIKGSVLPNFKYANF